MYGTWLIDDISFSRIGTGWWGNEFGWQGGCFAADVLGVPELDAIVEYTRINPYVYSNREAGNDYTHDNISLGHHLDPNSDEWFSQLRYRLSSNVRLGLTFAAERHGRNVVLGDVVVRNVGGSALQGHRDFDSETVVFLDGDLETKNRLQMRIDYEPVTNIFFAGLVELRRRHDVTGGVVQRDILSSFQIKIEY